MAGHHLVLGELTDIITGEKIEDSHDERYRQKIAGILLTEKGYSKDDIKPSVKLVVKAGELSALVKMDFVITLSGKISMVIKYSPGSIITRHRCTIAASRLLAPYQIPVAVVTNGIDADILEGSSTKVISKDLGTMPDKAELAKITAKAVFKTITPKQIEMEARILYAFEIDGRCPCDDSVFILTQNPKTKTQNRV